MIFSFFTLLLFACGKEEVNPQDLDPNVEKLVFKENVHFLDADDFVSLVDVQQNTIMFKKSNNLDLEEEDIMYFSGDSTDFFVKRIDRAYEENDLINYELSDITIFDALEEYNFGIKLNGLEFRDDCDFEKDFGSILNCPVSFCMVYAGDTFSDDVITFTKTSNEDPKLTINFAGGLAYGFEMTCDNFELPNIEFGVLESVTKIIKDKLLVGVTDIPEGVVQNAIDASTGSDIEIVVESNIREALTKAIKESFVFDAGFAIIDIVLEGRANFSIITSFGFGINAEAELNLNLEDLLSEGIASVNADIDATNEGYEIVSELELDCGGHLATSTFTKFGLTVPEIKTSIALNDIFSIEVDIPKTKILETRSDFGINFDFSPITTDEGIKLKSTAQSYFKSNASSDLPLFGDILGDTNIPLGNPFTMGEIPLCLEVDFGTEASLVLPEGANDGELTLKVTGRDAGEFKLFVQAVEEMEIGNFAYNDIHKIPINFSINEFRVLDLQNSKCQIRKSIGLQIEDDPEEQIDGQSCCVTYFEDPRDNEIYCTTIIGGKEWFARNLRYENQGQGRWPNDDPSLVKLGKLYTWEEVNDASSLCPAGWHVPTIDEWLNMFESINEADLEIADKLKADYGWISNGSGVDALCFSIFPAGDYKRWDESYAGVGEAAYFWSSSFLNDQENSVETISLSYLDNYVNITPSLKGAFQYSCRCVKD